MVFLVKDPNGPRQPYAVARVVAPLQAIAAIADLCSSILAVISITVRILSPAVPILSAIPIPTAISALAPIAVVAVAVPLVSMPILLVLRIYRTAGRQPEKRHSNEHRKYNYSFFHNIFSSRCSHC